MRNTDILIIGGGPAGLAAAVGAYEAGARDILIDLNAQPPMDGDLPLSSNPPTLTNTASNPPQDELALEPAEPTPAND